MRNTTDIVNAFYNQATAHKWPPMQGYRVLDGGKSIEVSFRDAEKKYTITIFIHESPRQPSNIIEALGGGSGEVEQHLHVTIESARMKLQFTFTYPDTTKLHENIFMDLRELIDQINHVRVLPEVLSGALPSPTIAASSVN